MGKTLQFVLRITRIIAIALCSFVLIASLVMWPRSLFYLDHVRIPFTKGQFPLIRSAGGLPGGTVVGGYPCFNSIAGRIAIVGTGPHPGADNVSRLQGFRASSTEALPSRTMWLPRYNPTRPALLLPYWLTAFTAIVGLAVCLPSKPQAWLSRPRFGIAEVLFAIFAAAVLITTARLVGQADAVIVGEGVALGFVAWKSIASKNTSIGQRSRVEWAVGAVASVGVVAAVAFAVFIHVGYLTHFVPIASS
jgi:hypothetical protein